MLGSRVELILTSLPLPPLKRTFKNQIISIDRLCADSYTYNMDKYRRKRVFLHFSPRRRLRLVSGDISWTRREFSPVASACIWRDRGRTLAERGALSALREITANAQGAKQWAFLIDILSLVVRYDVIIIALFVMELYRNWHFIWWDMVLYIHIYVLSMFN